MENDFDVVVVGASFAGSSFVRNLARHHGWRVLMVDFKKTAGQTVESTGLITEHTRQLINGFFDVEPYITNRITTIAVVATDFERHFFSESPTPWINQTATRALVQALAPTDDPNVTIWTSTSYLGNDPLDADGRLTVRLRRDGHDVAVRTRFLIGADGGGSQVALNNALDRNRRFLFGIEEVYYGQIHLGEHPEETIYHFWFGEFSLGYGGWISATMLDGRPAFRIGLAKNSRDAKDARVLLRKFTDTLVANGTITIDGPADAAHGVYGSNIPIGGPLRRIYAPGVLLIGDAAGFCGAFAADGIKGAAVSAIESAALVNEFLSSDRPRHALFRQLRRRMNGHHQLISYYRKQLFYRFVWDRMKSNRSFDQMFDIIATEKEGFLRQFCDSKEKGRSLASLVITPRNLPRLVKYAWLLLLDLFKK